MEFFLPAAILVTAFILDQLIGDPETLPHPIRWIGRSISILEKIIRPFTKSAMAERAGGVVLALVIAPGAFFSSAALLYYASLFSPTFYFIISVLIVWSCLSVKSLGDEAQAVIKTLEKDGLDAARARLGRIVGRDTKNLGREGVLKAATETVSENTSDGIVAPLFYFAIGGPALMFAYKAVNTLDSMVGYKNEKYLRFGWFSARLDDAANYLPSRLTAALMVTIAVILGYNWKRSIKTLFRDGRNHPSPNSGLPEAAVAGALGVRFGGPMSYGGVISNKPFIGDDLNAPTPEIVKQGIRMMRAGAVLMVLLVLAAFVCARFIL